MLARLLPLDVVDIARMTWVLRLLPSAGAASLLPDQRISGLSCPLRLALSAQAAGASRIELAPGAESCGPLLRDARLPIKVNPAIGQPADPIPPDLVVEVPWNLVVHRDQFRALVASGAAGTRPLLDQPFALSGSFCFDPVLVVDRAHAKQAEKMLLRSLRKTQDGWTSTYLNRHISLFLTRWLVRTPLRPNQVSVGILVVGVVGAALASRGTYPHMLAGAVLFQIQSILDGCDGEMSRLTYRGSRLGEWLDTIGDDLTNYGFFAATAWGLHTATGWWGYLVAGVVTVGCGLITSGIEYRYLWRIGSGDLLQYPLGVGKAPASSGVDKGAAARFLDAIAPLFKRDTFVLLTLMGAVVGALGPFLIAFALGGIGILTAVVRAEIRMSRERRLCKAVQPNGP